MTGRIDPREVLTYLNELGYTNISAQQLKEFIKDLKKVIKYDSRYGGASNTLEKSYFGYGKEYYECPEESASSRQSPKKNKQYKHHHERDKENDPTHSHNSKNIKHSAKDKHIAVHIYNKKNRTHLDHPHCIHASQIENENVQIINDKVTIRSTSVTSKPESTESTIKSICACKSSCSCREMQSRVSKASSKGKKSKVTFIRPSITKSSFNKCDPVALYQYYQSEWKKTKIPGEENRDDLRWAIREKMLSGPRMRHDKKLEFAQCVFAPYSRIGALDAWGSILKCGGNIHSMKVLSFH